MSEIKNKKVLILGLTFVVLVISLVIGLTYAFFTAEVTGNDDANPITVTTGELELTLTDTNILSLPEAFPGASQSKTFTVRNTGTLSTSYDIIIDNVSTDFEGTDLVYIITSDNGGGTKTETVLPNTDETLIEDITIGRGVLQTYTITVVFKETGSNQNNNQGKSYTGRIQIVPRIASVAIAGYITDLNGDALARRTVLLHSDPRITETDENGYYEFRNVPVGKHTVTVKEGDTVLAEKEITLLLGTSSRKKDDSIIELSATPTKYLNVKVDEGLDFTIETAQLLLSENSGTLYVGGDNKELTISGKGYGNLSCSSSNNTYATCSVVNNKLIIHPVSVGNGTITLLEDKTNNTIEYPYEVLTTSITLSEASGDVYIDKTKTITASGTNMGRLYCGTTNSEIATCTTSGNSIIITGEALGIATITVREENGNQTATFIADSKYDGDLSIIAFYVDNEPIEGLDPQKYYDLLNYECTNDEAVSWDIATKSINVTPISLKTSCSLYFHELEITIEPTYDYLFIPEGDYVQTFRAPVNGTYKLETWGAKGSNYTDYLGTTAAGGNGGYSVGYLNLLYGDVLYIVVGGRNGINGGGVGVSRGGGATHIATISLGNGMLSQLVNDKEAVIMVAGGGGGGGSDASGGGRGAPGGAGGGQSGERISSSSGGYGGTQSSGGAGDSGDSSTTPGGSGSFGQGGNVGGGGGGGWYGGGGGNYCQMTEYRYFGGTGGGGGSGYINIEANGLTDAYTYSGSSSFLSPTGVIETGHSENGYARITYIGD